MYRRNITLSPLARACQTGALLLILSGILGLLVHTIAVERRPEQVVGTKQDVR
jgi:hypothetical protein